MTRDQSGNPQIDTTELIRVFGALSQVSQKKIVKKSQNVAGDLSQQNNDDRVDKLLAAVEKLQKVVEKQSEQISSLLQLEYKPVVEQVAPTEPVKQKIKREPLPRRERVRKKKVKNGYASALGLPNVITEDIHLKIMAYHNAGATSQQIANKLHISRAPIIRTINATK